MKILEELPHVFTENAEDFNKLHDYVKTSEGWGKIVDFLNECKDNVELDEIDKDDIIHILDMDFDYIRKQHDDWKQQKLNES